MKVANPAMGDSLDNCSYTPDVQEMSMMNMEKEERESG